MKKVLIIFCLLLITNNNFAEETTITENPIENFQKPVEQKIEKIILDVKSVYDSLNIENKIDYSIFQKAYLGYVQIQNKNPGVLIIIDYTKPSNEERFYVLDMNKKKLVYLTRVAHSKNSGLEIPLQFSDDPNSYQSSLGFFVTLGEYNGAYGYSLRLKGLEENINTNAEDRAIVIHGGDIVEDEYIKKFGFAGRSLGCPVLPHSLTREIIDYIKHGRVLFIYGNDEEYIEDSLYLSKLAYVFEGSPKNIVEIEKIVETPKVSPAVTTVATINPNVPVVVDNKKDNISRENMIAETNIMKIFEIIKQEAKYTNNMNNNKISYTELLKTVIREKINKMPETKILSENESLEEKKDNQDNTTVQNTTNVNLETKTDDEMVLQEVENTEENKKEERKYPEEVIKKSLGTGVKLK